MRNFEDEDLQQRTAVNTQVPQVRQTVTVRPRAHQTYLTSHSWSWSDLRDYVTTESTRRFGQVWTPDPLKESGIFKGFLKRWGDQAEAIARCAFEDHDGVWLGEPITPSRFTKGADPYFAEPISQRLMDTLPSG